MYRKYEDLLSVKLVSYSRPGPEFCHLDSNEFGSSIENLISYCARVSNPSNQDNLKTHKKLIKYLLDHKHFSPFEMVNVCLEVVTTRDIGRQILRHASIKFQEFCVSGDTEIYFTGPSKLNSKFLTTNKMKISDLYNKWHNGTAPIRSRWDSEKYHVVPLKDCIAAMNIKYFDQESGHIDTSHIKDIYFTGNKELYEFELYDGKKIKCTADHKFLTREGFFPIEDIVGLTHTNQIATMSRINSIAVDSRNYIPKWVKIKSVKYIGIEPTYDLEIENSSHNYIANGIITHNSQRYADPTEEFEFCLKEPRLQDAANRQNSIPIRDESIAAIWEGIQTSTIDKAVANYNRAINIGIAKEVARAILPEGNTLSRMYMNGSIRSWIHYIEARGPESGTQKEHMLIANECAKVICELFPTGKSL